MGSVHILTQQGTGSAQNSLDLLCSYQRKLLSIYTPTVDDMFTMCLMTTFHYILLIADDMLTVTS